MELSFKGGRVTDPALEKKGGCELCYYYYCRFAFPVTSILLGPVRKAILILVGANVKHIQQTKDLSDLYYVLRHVFATKFKVLFLCFHLQSRFGDNLKSKRGN